MSHSISMFTATADLEGGLTTLCATACRLPRDVWRRPLAELRDHLASEAGHAALLRLATGLHIDSERVPSREVIASLFDDELLSMKALALHRGRNVYSAGKLALWEQLWLPFRDCLLPSPGTLDLAKCLVALDTRAGRPDSEACVSLLTDRLRALGFEVETVCAEGCAPILLARRSARGGRGRVVLYGHYDTADTDQTAWATPPFELHESRGRLFGSAVADNKGALALRLDALTRIERTPELVWLLQGEEEAGSPLAHRHFPELLRGLDATLWLEENGYQDVDGTQRLLARTMGAMPDESLPPDRGLWRLVERLAEDAAVFGVGHRVESRGLNKDFFPEGCPFARSLPRRGRYLAIGIDDPLSTIHRPNESVPLWTFALHERQLATLFAWADEIAMEDP